MKKTVAELFAGVGGFRVGLNNIRKINIKTGKAIEEGNWDFVWANQWEPSTKNQDAYNCYITRFEAEDVSNKDIGTVDKNSIPNHNLLVGGFPCQDYSVARSISNEKGIEGKKGVLFWEIVETLEKKETPLNGPETNLKNKYWIDYIRGYVDGDGSINYIQQGALRWQVCSATPEILEFIIDYFHEEYDIPKVKVYKTERKGSLYYFQYSTNATKKIFNFLYTPNSIFLKRKKDKYIEVLNLI